ncbi:helix-turn-helix domain-containing protein, partial [Actinomadura kijaniata]|uniref:helix-turn-helix domain-containing protein n=1 Tax=Actinomadura kijaniata TaxID=46161 RepID=UPI003F1989D4
MAELDPSQIRTHQDLVRQLAMLFDRDGRGYQTLAAAAGLSAGALHALINGQTARPRRDTVERFVRACGQDPQPWREALGRLADTHRNARRGAQGADEQQRGEPLGRVIGELGEQEALALEVHQASAAGSVPVGSVLPPYLPRAGFDDRLRAEVAAAEHESRLVMVIGDSSVGKTRACWEAVRAVLPHWRLWHPLTPERPLALVEALQARRLAARTVIWLNEAQFYLQPPGAGERVAAELQALLAGGSPGPVLVLGSMWPDFWKVLTATPPRATDPDPHQAARTLLSQSPDITAPAHFTDQQLTDLTATISADPRLRAAAQRAPGGRLTQELAGAPELLRRYRHASPAARAVLWAAIDARRLGHGPYLTEALTHQLAAAVLQEGPGTVEDVVLGL